MNEDNIHVLFSSVDCFAFIWIGAGLIPFLLLLVTNAGG